MARQFANERCYTIINNSLEVIFLQLLRRPYLADAKVLLCNSESFPYGEKSSPLWVILHFFPLANARPSLGTIQGNVGSDFV